MSGHPEKRNLRRNPNPLPPRRAGRVRSGRTTSAARPANRSAPRHLRRRPDRAGPPGPWPAPSARSSAPPVGRRRLRRRSAPPRPPAGRPAASAAAPATASAVAPATASSGAAPAGGPLLRPPRPRPPAPLLLRPEPASSSARARAQPVPIRSGSTEVDSRNPSFFRQVLIYSQQLAMFPMP